MHVQRQYLRKQLGGDEKALSPEMMRGRLPSAFHNVMVCILGEYRDALRPGYEYLCSLVFTCSLLALVDRRYSVWLSTKGKSSAHALLVPVLVRVR